MFKKLFIALLAVVGVSFAGQISINSVDSTNFSEHLTKIDSIRFGFKDSCYMVVFGSENYLASVSKIRNIEFVTDSAYEESITIDVSSGVSKGKNTLMLKDVKSIDFIEMEDTLDTDNDGITDVAEIYIFGSDPEAYDAPKVLAYNIYKANEKIGSVEVSKGSIDIKSIPTGPVVVEAVMEEPTESVSISIKDSPVEVTKVDSKHFRFTMPALMAAEKNQFLLKAVSETGMPTRYLMAFNMEIQVLNLMLLSTSDNHQVIHVNFMPSQKDARITGYAILRAGGSKNADNSALANLSLTSSEQFIDKLLPSGVSVLKTIDAEKIKDYESSEGFARYTDPVGGPSPYYTYRVVAYVKENIDGKDVYSYKLTDVATKSVGNIVFKYQAVEFGTKYDTWTLCRADMRLYADVFPVSSGVPANDKARYNYWFYNAGSDDDKDKMIWETKADRSKKELDVVGINTNTYSINVDRKGVGILLANDSDCGSYSDNVRHAVSFSYDQLAEAIAGYSGTEWEDYVFTYGQGGVTHDGSCSNCGKKPHAGWKFKFLFEWND